MSGQTRAPRGEREREAQWIEYERLKLAYVEETLKAQDGPSDRADEAEVALDLFVHGLMHPERAGREAAEGRTISARLREHLASMQIWAMPERLRLDLSQAAAALEDAERAHATLAAPAPSQEAGREAVLDCIRQIITDEADEVQYDEKDWPRVPRMAIDTFRDNVLAEIDALAATLSTEPMKGAEHE